MKITYDKQADAKYILLDSENKNTIATTKKLADWLIVDFAKNEEIVGIEILNASKNSGSFLVGSNTLLYAPPLRPTENITISDSLDSYKVFTGAIHQRQNALV